MTNPPLDQHFRRAHALRAEAAQHLTPEVRTLVEARISIQDRARGVGPMDALFFEKWRTFATGPAKTLLDQANDCYWQVVVQMDNYCRKQAGIHHRRLMYDFEDLYQAARMGCWRAAVRFDPDRGYKFVSFADDWVRVACDRCRNQDHDLTIGVQVAANGRWGLARASRLDAPIKALEGETLLIERIAAEEVETPDTMALTRLREVMDKLDLTDFERACLESVGEDGPTLTEIGKRFGKSREWARQIRNRAFAKIKAAMLAETQETKEDEMAKVRWPYFRKNPIIPGVCLVEGCSHDKILWRGVCKTHYNALAKYGKLDEFALPPQSQVPPPLEIHDRGEHVCLVKGCNNGPHGRGFCRKHYQRARVDGIVDSQGRPPQNRRAAPTVRIVPVDGICLIEGCERKRVARGLCINCYNNARNDGTLEVLALPPKASPPRKPEPTPEELPVASYPGPLPDELINPVQPAPPPVTTAPIQLTREDLWRRYELLNRADSIRGLADARAPLTLGGVELPLTPALEKALREHADALEAEALRGAA